MITEGIVCFSDLDEVKRMQAIEVFLEGFGHMFTFAKTRAELVQLFSVSFEESLVYAYVAQDRVSGILGIGTNAKRAIKLDKQICKEVFGKGKGAVIYNTLYKVAGIPAVKKETDLYIDYLATDAQKRKQGIATKILTFACELPQYRECYIEVLSKNVSALRLYQDFGFTLHKKSFNIFMLMQGFGYPIMMKKLLR